MCCDSGYCEQCGHPDGIYRESVEYIICNECYECFATEEHWAIDYGFHN